jgi:hypothetical protein
MTTPAKNGYALGVAIGEIAGARVVQHGGGISGFNSYLAYYPDTKVTVVALSNLNGPGAESIAGRFGTLAQGKPVVLHSERKSIKVPRATLEKYVGTYQLSPGFDIFVAIDGERLTGHATGQSPIPLAAETETKFYPEAFEAELEFQLDARGKVTGAVWRQNGQDMLAPRTSDKVPAKPKLKRTGGRPNFSGRHQSARRVRRCARSSRRVQPEAGNIFVGVGGWTSRRGADEVIADLAKRRAARG